MKHVQIYTDGACSGNPGPGGWGAIIVYKDIEKELAGSESNTTNNRMELTAAIKAIEALKESCCIDLFTDSKYLKDGITKWIYNWLKNGWKGANKKPIKNQELWESLHNLTNNHKITSPFQIQL